MLSTYVFILFSTISLAKVNFVGVNRICFIPKILDSDDVNMLELSRIVTKYIIESNSELEDVNNHLFDLCTTNDKFDGLLTCYKGYITDLSRYLLSNSCHAAYKNKETYQLLKSFELLCECIKSGKYKSFYRDVCQLMFDYEQLLNVSAITKKFVTKTYLLENLTACLCKFLGFRKEYRYILVCDITFLMHQNTSSIMLAQNIEDLDNIIAKQYALDFCIELVIDEAQLLNIIYDFEYKKHNPSAVKEIDAANFTFDEYLKSMFPELTTPNRFANIIYMPWTDIDEKINFYIRHAKHNVLRECSKQCFIDRLTTIKNYLEKILLENKVLLKAEDKPTRHIIAFRSRVNIF